MSLFKNISIDFGKIFKRILLCLLFVSFLIVLIQEVRPFRPIEPLKGYFIPKVYSAFTLRSWIEGEYQSKTESFLNEDFGFRNFLVRLNNQLKFWIFKVTRAEAVVIGKENYLYEYGYIIAYNGKDFLGEKAINDSVAKIKFLQDTLKSLGKQLLIVMAPSKVRIYPEYISDSLNPDPNHYTNYMFFKKYFDQVGVNYIDFNTIFAAKKATSPYLLFPQLGVHWSRLEAVRATDTIVKRLAKLSNSNLPEINIYSITEKDQLQDPDDDMVKSMNLLYYPEYKKMGYPEFDIIVKNKEMKNLLMVSDSYWWDIFLRLVPKAMFSSNEFWYYNKEVWGNSFIGKLKADSIDTKRRILQNDYIVIMGTESNYGRLGYGFIGQAISALKRPITPTKEELIEIKEVIYNDKKWHAQVIEKASLQKISEEEMLNRDANWYFQHHGPVKHALSIKDIKILIYSNKPYLEEITKKAAERKISVDSMATEDAIWCMKNETNFSDSENSKDLSFEKIKEKIRHNYEWMEQIRGKAEKKGISVDSMISIDAAWYIQQQKKQ